MKRLRLTRARARKHWTLEQAAEQLQVDMNTLSRWELGKTTPHPYNVDRLCQVYGVTAVELGLEDEAAVSAGHASPPEQTPEAQEEKELAHELVGQIRAQDLTLRLLKIVLSWPCRNTCYDELQWLILQETEDRTTMTPTQEDPVSRRDALRRLALLPIELYGLTNAGQVLKSAPTEDLLAQCAAGLVACQHFSRGQHDDMVLADTIVSYYLPTLQSIVKDSSNYRKQAAGLVAQALLLKATLIVHLRGVGFAIPYAEQAATYSKESDNLSLQLVILKRLSWIYSLSKQRMMAVDRTLQAGRLLKQSSQPVSPLIQCITYSSLAKYQALGGRYDDALVALPQAHQAFFASSNEKDEQTYVDFDRLQLIVDEGMTYYHMGQYEKAFDTLAQGVDPETLTAKTPALSERVRIETINYQTLASLKRHKKDRELSIKLWKAGVQGAKVLKSEQRFAEAHTAYEIMESLWGGDKPLNGLRDFLDHW